MINKIKKLFSPKKDNLPRFDISRVETEEDYWNAAWNVQKGRLADQFVQCSQDKDVVSGEQRVMNCSFDRNKRLIEFCLSLHIHIPVLGKITWCTFCLILS